MIYLVEPNSVYRNAKCVGVVQPLYGIPPEPCRSYCGTYCSTKF